MKHSGKSMRARLMATAAAGAILMTAGQALAQEVSHIDLAPQSLASALYEFGRQTGHQVIFSPDLTRAKNTQGVSGAADEQLAMAQLLNGTGLTYRRDGNTYMIVSASDPQSGSAAGDGADNGTVQALIVTAQKREENIQDVPIAMSAFTQEELTRSQVAGGPDLMTQVPNMTFTKTNFTSYSIQLRGIGTQAISATTDNAVAVAFNNTPFIRNRFFEQEFYDLQRVEVLRGPQGTLYGRNATAGVVNLISQKPKFTYEAKLSADVANYSSSRLEGMLNIPLVDDIVALRIAGAWTKREGYSTNQITGNPIDGRNLWSTRATLRFTPNDRLDANLIWEHFKEDDDRLRSGKQLCHTHTITDVGGFPVDGNNTPFPDNGQGDGTGLVAWAGVQGTLSQGCLPSSLYSPDSFEVPNGMSVPYYGPLSAQALPAALVDPYASTTQSHDLRVIESTVDPLYQANTDTVELQISYDLTDHLALTSETGYAIDEIFSTQDFNRFNTQAGAWDARDVINGVPNIFRTSGILDENGVYCDPQIGCADRLVGIDVSTARSRHFSQEFRIGSSFDGPLNFSLGGNFLRYDTEDKYYVMFNSLTMYAAQTGKEFQGATSLPESWQPGISDNQYCLPFGMRPPNANRAETILGCVYIDPNSITSLNDQGHNYFLSKNPYKLISYAVFGEAYYNITDDLKLTAGLRWTVDKKEAPRIPSWVLGANYVGYSVAEVVRQEWREPTGRLALDWKPDLSFTDQTLVYGSYAHGYKAGGMNPPPAGLVIRSDTVEGEGGAHLTDYLAGSATHPRTFDAEFIDAFELGSKNTLLDGALTLNLASFYYDYKGYQISQIVNRSAVNLNFDATVWGLELESNWRPVENLRLGLKLGYEKTKVADGMRAIDTMDRTNGDPKWVVVSPFPTQPSNCVLPVWLFVGNRAGGGNPDLVGVGGQSGGNAGGCELAYILRQDPVTTEAYTLLPSNPPYHTDVNYAGWSTDPKDYPCWPTGAGDPGTGTAYPGVDPACLAALSNNGEGFYKDLSGKELPNAPHITATLTADYTVPLPSDWLMTFHTDLYYQSEAWTRIFNTPGYDKLKAYTNVNLAAIFTNDDAGWTVMAYVKNIFDRDSITGAFLNSDDTGLTTNVFLTEPRLYGLRVTKNWSGGPWWTGANPNHAGPYPFTVELSGQVQRQDAPYEPFAPASFANVSDALNTTQGIQNRNLDWGDGRSVRLTYRPEGSPWSVSATMRYGRTNGGTHLQHQDVLNDPNVCAFLPGIIANLFCNPESAKYIESAMHYPVVSFSDVSARDQEKHEIVDFVVGREFGLGSAFSRSEVSAGLRYASFNSSTRFTARALDNWNIPQGWSSVTSTVYESRAAMSATRKFRGAGPTVSWDAAVPLLGNDRTGHLDLDWTVTGGVLFGDRKTQVVGDDMLRKAGVVIGSTGVSFPVPTIGTPTTFPVDQNRSQSGSVPVADLSLGLSYEAGRMKVGAGYRWERYFDVLDTGFESEKKTDRTIDGPYFKIAIGFGG
jgi:outer membrane receptor protein involved in Fe transport